MTARWTLGFQLCVGTMIAVLASAVALAQNEGPNVYTSQLTRGEKPTLPADRAHWAAELKRLREALAQEATALPPNTERLALSELSKANLHQLIGIAQRHLGQLAEASLEIDTGISGFEALSRRLDCTRAPMRMACSDATRGIFRGRVFKTDVEFDRRDAASLALAGERAIAAAPDDVERFRLRPLLLRRLAMLGALDHAIQFGLADLEAALLVNSAHEREVRAWESSNQLSWLCGTIAYSISWDPSDGRRRSSDPEAFADMYGIGIGRQNKYGMVSMHEDGATITTLLYVEEETKLRGHAPAGMGLDSYRSADDLRANLDVSGYAHAQLASHKLEFPLKILLETSLNPAFPVRNGKLVCPSIAPRVTLSEIEAAFRSTPGKLVPEATTEALAAVTRGVRFVRAHCADGTK